MFTTTILVDNVTVARQEADFCPAFVWQVNAPFVRRGAAQQLRQHTLAPIAAKLEQLQRVARTDSVLGAEARTLLPDFCNAVDSLSASLPWIGRSGVASDTPAAAAEAAAGVVSPGGASPPAGRSEEGATMRLLGHRQAVSAVAVPNKKVRHRTWDLHSRYQQPNLEWGQAGASLEQEGRVHLGATCAFVFAAEGGGMEVFVGRLRQLVTTTTGSGAKGAKKVYATSVMVDDPTATFFAHPYLLVQRDGEHVRLVHRGAELHETFHFTASDPDSDSDGGQGTLGGRDHGGPVRFWLEHPF